MIQFVLPFLFIIAFVTLAAAQSMSPDAFTKEYIRALQSQAPHLKVAAVRPLELKVKGAPEQEITVYLDNAYQQYASSSADKEDIIERYVQAFVATVAQQEAPLDPSRIVPVVKDRAWLGEFPAEKAYDDLNEDLVILFAEDTEKNIRYLSEDELKKAGIKRDKLRDFAIGNLKKLLPDVHVERGALVSMVTAGGTYEASLLLLSDFWIAARLGIENDIVIAVPARDVLLVASSKNEAGIARLQELATEFAQDASYRLTDLLFVYRGGRFQRFNP